MDFEMEVVECDPMCTVEQQISKFWKIWKKGTTIFVVEQGTLEDLGYIPWLFKLRGKNKFACIPYIREDSVYNNPYFYINSYLHFTMSTGNFPDAWTAILKIRDTISMSYK